MSNKIKFSSETMTDILKDREQHPEDYLFTAAEFKLIYKAREAVIDIADRYHNAIKENFTPDLQAQMLIEYAAAFRRRRIPLTKMRKLAEKAAEGRYWSLELKKVKLFGKYGANPYEIFELTTNTPEEYPPREITPDNCPEYYKAASIASKAQALGIPAFYRFVSIPELNIINSLNVIIAQIQAAEEQARADAEANEALKAAQSLADYKDTLLPLVSSPILNARNNIGSNARKPAESSKRLNEKGEQISIFEFQSNNVDFVLESAAPIKNVLLTVGDPNTDKLIKQALYITMQTGAQKVVITSEDFKTFRKLKDRKTITENMNDATLGAEISRYREHTITPQTTKRKSIPYFKSVEYESKRRAGSKITLEWNDEIYEHINTYTRAGTQIMLYDPRINYLPNNKRTEYNIINKMTEHTRTNAGRPNAHTLKVKTLLDVCHMLPLYPETKEEQGQEGYLKFPSQAPEKIIIPFVGALDFITEPTQPCADYQYLKIYKFTKAKGQELTPGELSEALKDYKKFINLNIEYKFTNEPDYTHLIDAKAKRQELAAQASAKKKRRQ